MSYSARPQWDQFNFSVLILLESLLKLDKMQYTRFHLEDVRVCCDVFEVFIQKKREIQRCFQNCTLHAWLQALIPRESKGIPDVNRWLKQNRASRWIIKAEIDLYWCAFLRHQKLSSLTLRKVICSYCMCIIKNQTLHFLQCVKMICNYERLKLLSVFNV